MIHPMEIGTARGLANHIIEEGEVELSDHAQKEFADEDPPMDILDAVNLIQRAKMTHQYRNGEHRYRFETPRMAVVVVFESETYLRVVTGWRK